MFWNKDKIPNNIIKTDEYDVDLSQDKDLFYYDQDDDSDDSNKYTVIQGEAELFSLNDTNLKNDLEEGSSAISEKRDVFDRRIDFANKIAKIILIVVVFIGTIVSIDIICVTRFDVGPFFSVRTKVMDDGGTKIYHGLGYKVIKYRQTGGRNDLVLGSWLLKYSTVAKDVDIVDLAIDFNSSNGDKYMNQFIRVEGEVLSNTNNEVTLIYLDDGGKYTTKLVCSMADGDNTVNIGDKKRVVLVGTLYDYNTKKATVLKMKNCYLRDK